MAMGWGGVFSSRVVLYVSDMNSPFVFDLCEREKSAFCFYESVSCLGYVFAHKPG